MEVRPEHSDGEIKRLQRCVNDLVSLLALPAIWSGGDPSQIVETLLDALTRMLSLDLICVRLNVPSVEAPIEIARMGKVRGPMPPTHDICEALYRSLGDNSRKWPPLLRPLMGNGDVSIVPLRLGLHGELGMIIAAAQRANFPQQTEALLLSVAAGQASIGLQEARPRNQQKRIADDLDQRVAQQTAELAAANEELQLQVGLLQHLPVSAWTLKPDGTPDFVNQVWLDYSGQTLDFVRSHPEAWMTAVHPEDRETASRSFWEGVRSEQGFAFESRSLRVRDATYRWHLQQAVALRDAEGKLLKFVGTTTDIDDQKRAQEELRASEGKLQRVIDTIPTFVWCNLPDGPNEFLSEGWHQYTGLSPEEAHGWGWSAAFHPDDLPPLMKRWQELLVSGESGEIEARLRRHDGEYRWFLIRVAPFRNHTGAIERWYGTSTDIHDRKLAEEKVRASETSLRQALDSIPGWVATFTPAGQADFFNQRILEYFGKTPEEMNAWATNDLVHPDDLPRIMAEFAHSFTTGTPFDTELRYRRGDGVQRWFQARILPSRDTEGRIARWYALVTDIEDRKRAEERLQASETNLRQIVDSIPGLVCVINPAGKIELANRPLIDYFGMMVEELNSWGTNGAVHPDDLHRVIVEFTHSITTGTAYDSEIRYRRADGVYRWFHVRIVPVRDTEDRITRWYCLITDIEDRKRAEEALSKAQSELAHVTRVTSLGAMTASIAHEVNQPLTGIVTNANTCLRMLATEPPQVEGARETARRTIRDANRMSEVITRLRSLFSKKELTTEPVNLNEAVLEVIALSIVDLQKNRVMLRPELAHNLPLVAGDRVQLQQVMLNLLRNGSDAMSTVEDRPRQLFIRTERDEGDCVRLTVQDAGVGFDPQAIDRLFDAFYTTKGDGMGIGLSVSRSIIERHHGRLWATLNQGPGAAFSFSIPRAPERLGRADGIRNTQEPAATGPGAA